MLSKLLKRSKIWLGKNTFLRTIKLDIGDKIQKINLLVLAVLFVSIKICVFA